MKRKIGTVIQTDGQQRVFSWPALGADALALALAVGLPLYMPNGYVELIGHKFDLLLRCTMIAMVWLALACFWKNRRKTALRRFSFVWLWPIGLCLCYTAAWYFAQDRYTALWGLSGRSNGLMLYLACTVVYLIVAAAGTAEGAWLVLRVLVAVGCVVTGISWLNYWMIDPLDAYYTFLPDTGELFLGTVGNINFYGALLCLCVPLAVGDYLRGTRQVGGRYAVALWLCSGLLCAGSDAAWLGCAVAGLVFCCTRKTTTRTLGRGAALCAGLTAIALITGFGANIWVTRAALRTVSAWLARPLVGIPLLVLFLLAAIFLSRCRSRPAAAFMKGTVAVLLLLIVVLFVVANVWQGGPEALAALRFGEHWASNRGYVWKLLWITYTQYMTPLQKLIGMGGDAVKARLYHDMGSVQYMILINGEAFDSAHNEFLQHLICGGALGLLCWCGFCVAALRRGFRNHPALGAALLAYIVQSFFSISMPGVFPLVFVLAGLAKPEPVTEQKEICTRLAAGGTLLFAAALSLLLIP